MRTLIVTVFVVGGLTLGGDLVAPGDSSDLADTTLVALR